MDCEWATSLYCVCVNACVRVYRFCLAAKMEFTVPVIIKSAEHFQCAKQFARVFLSVSRSISNLSLLRVFFEKVGGMLLVCIPFYSFFIRIHGFLLLISSEILLHSV